MSGTWKVAGLPLNTSLWLLCPLVCWPQSCYQADQLFTCAAPLSLGLTAVPCHPYKSRSAFRAPPERLCSVGVLPTAQPWRMTLNNFMGIVLIINLGHHLLELALFPYHLWDSVWTSFPGSLPPAGRWHPSPVPTRFSFDNALCSVGWHLVISRQMNGWVKLGIASCETQERLLWWSHNHTSKNQELGFHDQSRAVRLLLVTWELAVS